MKTDELSYAACAKIEKCVKFAAIKGLPFGGALNLNKLAGSGHGYIDIDIGPTVFNGGEVKKELAIDNAATDGGHRLDKNLSRDEALAAKPLDSVMERHIGSRYSRGARAAIGIYDIAVNLHGSLAEFLKIDDRSQNAANESLYLCGATIDLADVSLLP